MTLKKYWATGLVLCYSLTAFGWGSTGHEKLAEVATELSTSGRNFWTTNKVNMGILANVPDSVWKGLPTGDEERPTHFFEPDSYFNNPSQFNLFPRSYTAAVAKYTEESLNETGTATWRVKQLYELAVASLKKRDFVSGLQYAGTMAHYIGDLSQPLHVTKNYDGQETGNRGIHAYFESSNLNTMTEDQLVVEVTKAGTKLVKNSMFISQSSGKIIDTAFNEVNRAYALKDDVIDTDLELGRGAAGSAAQLKIAIGRLADGAGVLAIVLSRIWIDAGNPVPTSSEQEKINEKLAWVKPVYAGKISRANFDSHSHVEHDCDLP